MCVMGQMSPKTSLVLVLEPVSGELLPDLSAVFAMEA